MFISVLSNKAVLDTSQVKDLRQSLLGSFFISPKNVFALHHFISFNLHRRVEVKYRIKFPELFSPSNKSVPQQVRYGRVGAVGLNLKVKAL